MNAEQKEAYAMLDAVDQHRKRVADSANDPGHYRVLYGGRVVYVPTRYDEDLPDFMRRCANEIERLLATDCSDQEGVSHMTIDWEMDEGWSACLVIE